MPYRKLIRPEQFDHVFELAHEGIVTVDADGRIDYINERGASILGYTPQEMIGRVTTDFDMPEANVGQNLTEMQGKRLDLVEHCFRRKDGSPVWTLGSTQILFDESGAFAGGLGVYIDITEHKLAMEALRLSEERFRAIATAGSDVIFRISADWTEVLELYGRDIPGQERIPFSEWIRRFILPEDRPRLIEDIVKAVRSKSVFESEHRYRAADGEVRWTLSRAVPMTDAGGRIIEWFGTAKDVTGRKRAEEALKKSERRFELLSEANAVLLSSQEPEKVIQSIAGKVLRHLDCDIFSCYFLDELQGKLRLKAYHGASKHTAEKVEWIDLGTSVCGCVARDGRSIICEDVQQSDDCHVSLLRALGVRAYACFPIRIGERTIGTLAFGSRERRKFEADEIALMRIVAEQFSVSIKRRRAELAVKEREEHFARAQMIAHMGSFTWDIKRDLLNLSDEAYRISGLEKGPVVRYDTIVALTHPEDREMVESAVKNGLSTGVYDFDYRIKRGDGQQRFIQGQGIVTFDAQGSPAKMVGTVHDITDRKLLEMSLGESEAHLARAQKIAHVGSWEWDVDRDRISFTDEAYRIVGAVPSGSPVRNADAMAFVHPEDRELVASKAGLAKNQGAYEIEYRIIRKDGEVRTIRDIAEITVDEGDSLTKIVGTIQDITDRKRTEETLREREAHLTIAQQIAHIGSWVWDLEVDRFHASDEAYRILGLEPGELVMNYGQFLSFVHPEDRERVLQNAQTVDEQDAGDIEYRIVRKDGEVRYVHSHGVVSYRKDGRPLKATGVIQDITDRMKMEIALKESQQRFQALVETNVDFIWEMDSEGRYTYCSPQMEKLWGLKPEEMIGRTPFDVMPPEMRAEMTRQFLSVASDPAGFSGLETTALDARGSLRCVETSGVPFFDDRGKLLGFRGITRDVTDRKAREQEEIAIDQRTTSSRTILSQPPTPHH